MSATKQRQDSIKYPCSGKAMRKHNLWPTEMPTKAKFLMDYTRQ